NFNRFMAERAQKAIEEFPTTERDIQSLTVGISKDGFRLIKQEMQEFISRVVRIVDEDKNADQVYNVNVHLFPMSIPQTDKESDNE
ncbi:MAG TPA: TIGR02147 family protein, partial [Chitinispirillaceae bacterium]|nr:TIGR02147 family protein [Chitinispirillaceae bacterium]